jgi:hypothetical protein
MVKLFAPATGADVVALVPFFATALGVVEDGVVAVVPVATAGGTGIVDDGEVVVWARTPPAPRVLKSATAATVRFIDILQILSAERSSVEISR